MQSELLEYIFIKNPHTEIIKRSLELLYVRCIDKTNIVPQELIDAIWKCASDKHEDITRATLGVLMEVFAHLPLSILERFYIHIKAIPYNQFDETRVKFLKKYSEGAIQAMIRHRNELI